MIDLPEAESADPDGVQVALRAAQALWSRGDTSESLRWLRRAAESASDEGADLRSLQLAKAAAELRAKLFAGGDSPAPSIPPPDAGAASSAAMEGASASSAASASSPPSARPAPRAEDAHPPSRPPGSGPQYVVHRPREAPRQLMGLSSTTLETAVQRDSSAPASVPSWSADGDRRMSSAPPPLPRAALDDYEELDAEPEDEAAEDRPAWAAPAPTWRGRSEAAEDAPARAGSSVTAPSNPPPLPSAHAFGEDDDMRSEQPTVVIPPPEEARTDSRRASALPQRDGAAPDGRREFAGSWDRDARSPSWDGGSWDEDGRARGFGGAATETSLSEPAPPKLKARVHHQAVQVSFAPDPRVSGQFIVRALREGERPAAGERVALLVALEPGTPLV